MSDRKRYEENKRRMEEIRRSMQMQGSRGRGQPPIRAPSALQQHLTTQSRSQQPASEYLLGMTSGVSEAPSSRPIAAPTSIPSTSTSALGRHIASASSSSSQPFGRGRTHFGTGDDLLKQFDSSMTLGSASGSGMSSQQQTDPSLRPKVRSRSMTTGPPPPPYDYRNPTPDIVNRYRDPYSGDPDPTKLRYQGSLMMTGDSRDRGRQLANLSRNQINQMEEYDKHSADRQVKYLKSRDYRREFCENPEGIDVRYHPPRRSEDQRTGQRELLPSRPHDIIQRDDPRFNKPLRKMDAKPSIVKHSPIGRQMYGPASKRSQSVPDLSHQSYGRHITQIEEFIDRYWRLPKEQRETYDQSRHEINPRENPLARSRLVKPPTLGYIRDKNISRVGEMLGQRETFSRDRIATPRQAETERNMRRQFVKLRSSLPLSISDRDKRDWMAKTLKQPLDDRADEEQEEEDSYQE